MGIPGPFEILILLALLTLIVLPTIFWIWSIIDCATKEPSEGNDRLIWLLIIIFLNGLGALIYFFARRPKRIKECGK